MMDGCPSVHGNNSAHTMVHMYTYVNWNPTHSCTGGGNFIMTGASRFTASVVLVRGGFGLFSVSK